MAGLEDLSESTVEWLSLVRYQTLTAEEQARLGRPLSALAINTMQDAVESVLALIVQVRGGDVPSKSDFIKLFDAVADMDPSGALKASRPALLALNTARVGFKHHGNPPSDATLTRHVASGLNFVAAAVQAILDVDITEVSMLVFLKSEPARELLLKAQEEWNAGARLEAMESLRLAFDEVVNDYTRRKQWHPGKSLFSTKPGRYPNVFDLRETGLEQIDAWLQNLDQWVRYSALGVDLRQYAYFDAHAPSVFYYVNGGHGSQPREAVELTDEVFQRSYKFVIDTGLGLARDDYDFDHWAARRASAPSPAADPA